jgi:hypothetical protein
MELKVSFETIRENALIEPSCNRVKPRYKLGAPNAVYQGADKGI